jgi:hypothetical protein
MCWDSSIPKTVVMSCVCLHAQEYCGMLVRIFMNSVDVHCKASDANTSLKTASCEAGPGTTLMYSWKSVFGVC